MEEPDYITGSLEPTSTLCKLKNRTGLEFVVIKTTPITPFKTEYDIGVYCVRGKLCFKCELCDSELTLIVGNSFTPPKRCDQCKKFSLVLNEELSDFYREKTASFSFFSNNGGMLW